MGDPRGLTRADLRALAFVKAELVERQGWAPHPDRARVIRLIGALVDHETEEPLVFRMDHKGWVLGIGKGERISPPSDAIGEAVRVLHAAVALPFEPQPMLGIDLNPARINATRARQFIGERCPELAALLKRVRVSQDSKGKPEATYRPQADARPITTR